MKKHKLMTLLAAVMLTAPVAAMSTQKAGAVETKDAWTEYYRMGDSTNRSHPYSEAQSFIDISKKERKMIMDHFSSLLQGEMVPWWEYAKIEKVSALNNGTYTQELFIPLTYTPEGSSGNVVDGKAQPYMNEEPKERLYDALINIPGGDADYIGMGHYAGKSDVNPGIETSSWKLPLRDLTYDDQDESKMVNGIPSNKPIGVSIIRTIKNGTDPLKPVKAQVVDMDCTGKSAINFYRYKRVKKGRKHITKLVKAGLIPAETSFYVYGRAKHNMYKLGKNKYARIKEVYRAHDSVY